MIGLLVIQALRLVGCGRVIAVDLDESRLRLAAELELRSRLTLASATCRKPCWIAPRVEARM